MAKTKQGPQKVNNKRQDVSRPDSIAMWQLEQMDASAEKRTISGGRAA